MIETNPDHAGGLRVALRIMHDDWRRIDAPPGAWLILAFVLACGVAGIPQPLPKSYTRRAPKLCYANARALVKRARSLTYCEGYVAVPGLPLPLDHAWAIDARGRVVDPTLDAPQHCQYLGVPFSAADIERFRQPGSASLLYTPIETINVTPILAKCPRLRDQIKPIPPTTD